MGSTIAFQGRLRAANTKILSQIKIWIIDSGVTYQFSLIYKTVIFGIVLCGCESLPVSLPYGHGVEACDKKASGDGLQIVK